MSHHKIKYFILTGDPGVGKTTLTIKLASLLNTQGIKTSGFYTEEVRNHRHREGFDVVSLDGRRGCLARDQALLNNPSKFQVGKYGVLLKEFEDIALPSISYEPSNEKQLLVIDEIGKMEMFSVAFKNKIQMIFNTTSSFFVLATIPIRKGNNLIESIRNNSQARVWTVTRENRNHIHEEILSEMQSVFSA